MVNEVNAPKINGNYINDKWKKMAIEINPKKTVIK